jgi:hypothetical protein
MTDPTPEAFAAVVDLIKLVVDAKACAKRVDELQSSALRLPRHRRSSTPIARPTSVWHLVALHTVADALTKFAGGRAWPPRASTDALALNTAGERIVSVSLLVGPCQP